MQLSNPVQGILAALPAKPVRTVQPGATKDRQGSAAFDVQLAQAQATAKGGVSDAGQSPDNGPSNGSDKESGADQAVVAAPGEEKPVDDDVAGAMASAVLAAPVIWTPASDGGQEAQPLPEVGDAGERTHQIEPQAPEQGEALADVAAQGQTEGINILEGSAGLAQTDPETAAAATYDSAAEAAAVMDESAARAQGPAIGETLARMPAETPVISWELERQDAKGDPSSLENVDAGETAPPSRVEITQVVRREAETPQVEVKAQREKTGAKEKAQGPVAAQETRFAPEGARDDAEPVPALQVVEETQIQQAMGKTQFTMRLRPESLGEVTVRLTMTGDGISARIITRTESARQAIAQEIAALGNGMRDKGIDVRSVEVLDGSMGNASLLHEGRQGSGGRWGERPRGRGAVSAAAAEETRQEDLNALSGLTETLDVEVQA